MQRRQKISIGIVSVLAILLVGLAAYYSDFLGARYIKIGSGRLTVYQGEINTLQLKPIKQARKLELCSEKRTGATTTYVGCKTLVNSVKANATEVGVIIPATMTLGPATVLTRIRNTDGTLQPLKPTDQKIPLLVAASKKGSRGSGTSTASTSGTGGGSTSNTGSSSQSGTGTTPKVTPIIAPAPTPTYINCRLPDAGETKLVEGQGSKAELVVTNIDINPKIPRSGTPITATITLKNIGPATASKFYVEVVYDKYWDGYSDPFTGNSRNSDYLTSYAKYVEVGSLDSDQSTTITQVITNTTQTISGYMQGLYITLDRPTADGVHINMVPEYDDWVNNMGNCYWSLAS